jgi:hypothetical protein
LQCLVVDDCLVGQSEASLGQTFRGWRDQQLPDGTVILVGHTPMLQRWRGTPMKKHTIMPAQRPSVLLRLMTDPLIYYKPVSIGDTFFRECLTCGAIVRNEGLHSIYHEQQASPKRCPKCGLLDIGRHVCREAN